MLARNRLIGKPFQCRYQAGHQAFLLLRQALIATLVSAIAYPGLALSYPRPILFLKDLPAARRITRPQPPSTPPPNGTRSGGALGGTAACSTVQKPLVALIPVENPVLTASAHPTLFIYVPYGSSDVSFGEFSVLTGLQETTRLYHTRFTLPTTPGIVSISLPDLPAFALQENLFYHWYFKLYCQGNTSAQADLEVDGWVKRVASPAEQEQRINASPSFLWYDELARSAENLQADPHNREFKDRWRNLLKLIGAEELLQAPLVNLVTLVED
jgi:Domain of Unknown Function (DUF928)